MRRKGEKMGARIDVTELVKGKGKYFTRVEKVEIILPDEIEMYCPICGEAAFPKGQFHVRLTKQSSSSSSLNFPTFLGDCKNCKGTSLAIM